jgi:hypothetical protein
VEVSLARWLLAHELEEPRDPGALAAAAERVCRKLAGRLARLITLVGYQALVARALHLASAHFPFLAGVAAESRSDTYLTGLPEHVQGVDPAEVGDGLTAVLAHIVGLLTTFIGDDLTVHLLADVWPDIPLGRAAGDRWEAEA